MTRAARRLALSAALIGFNAAALIGLSALALPGHAAPLRDATVRAYAGETLGQVGALQERLRRREALVHHSRRRMVELDAETARLSDLRREAAARASLTHDDLAARERIYTQVSEELEGLQATERAERRGLGLSVVAAWAAGKEQEEAQAPREAAYARLLGRQFAEGLRRRAGSLEALQREAETLRPEVETLRAAHDAAATRLAALEHTLTAAERARDVHRQRHARAEVEVSRIATRLPQARARLDAAAQALAVMVPLAPQTDEDSAPVPDASLRHVAALPPALPVLGLSGRARGMLAFNAPEPRDALLAHATANATAEVEATTTLPALVPSARLRSVALMPRLAAIAPVVPPRSGPTLPVRGEVVSRFGNPQAGVFDKGILLRAQPGDTVTAPERAEVKFAQRLKSFGLTLILDHGGEYHTLLSGLGDLDVSEGQIVRAGQVLGRLSEDQGAEPRLYVELRRNGEPIDPLAWLDGDLQKVSG